MMAIDRDGQERVVNDFINLKNLDYVQSILNSLPYPTVVLNDKRQVVIANDELLKLLDESEVEGTLGKRLGELMTCVNRNRSAGGCGTSKHCEVCDVNKSICACLSTETKNQYETRLTVEQDDKVQSLDLEVTAAPFVWDNRSFVFFSLIDISNLKRRHALERIFFHDVINKAGSLQGLIEVLKNDSEAISDKEFVRFLEIISNDLSDEILYQRDLSAAESGDLHVKFHTCSSKDIIEKVVVQISNHEVAQKRKLVLDQRLLDTRIFTDEILCRRVLMNMVKNALEAIPKGETVTIGCRFGQPEFVRVWVHNPGCMPEDVQMQVFQRSFSTKGMNRGLGTYSIRLLGEQYLKGHVSFSSTVEEGTIFNIDIPVS